MQTSGALQEPSNARGEAKPLRKVQTRDSKEWARLRGLVEKDNMTTSPPISAYATGVSEESTPTPIAGTSPRVVGVQRPVPYRLSDHDCE
jgi:hypothetical protein